MVITQKIWIFKVTHLKPPWILCESSLDPARILLESCLDPMWILPESYINPAWILRESCLNPAWILCESFLLLESCLNPSWIHSEFFLNPPSLNPWGFWSGFCQGFWSGFWGGDDFFVSYDHFGPRYLFVSIFTIDWARGYPTVVGTLGYSTLLRTPLVPIPSTGQYRPIPGFVPIPANTGIPIFLPFGHQE